MNRPNILFAFADDWGRYASVYAQHEPESSINRLIQTPNVDRIANEGVLFKNAFVPAPSCTPCRSSVLSGQYFWQTGLGAILLGAMWDDSIPTFPLTLENEGGYFIGHTYKVWSPGRTANAPMGAERTQYNSAGTDFNHFSHWVTKQEKSLGIAVAKQKLYEEVRGNFKSFLQARDEAGGAPFCYWWGPHNTHRTWEYGSGKALWGLEPDDLKGRMPDFLPDVPVVREDACDYLGECLAFDRGLGIVLEELEASGELDNTLIVVSGDHGIPGMPRAKCNLYDIGCEVALMARLPGTIKPGRVVDDFINIMDLAPTFVEAGGCKIPKSMAAKSIMPLLTSDDNEQIEVDRDHVVTGRERHVHIAREGHLPYPQRSIRDKDYIFIINFEPDRWPMGAPLAAEELGDGLPDFEKLAYDTFVAYPDFDASPTKAWMVHHREENDVEPLYRLAFGKRPREELYDLRKDPHYMKNVAKDPEYAEVKSRLSKLLMDTLVEQNDPRVVENPCRFEHAPYAGPIEHYEPGTGVF